MAEPDEVLSPPYPNLKATTTNLYRILYALREWVTFQINQLKEEVPAAKAAELKYPKDLPNEDVWNIVSVVDHYTALMFARRIRETWDAILRDHELDWDSKLCMQKRYYLVQSACHVLSEAFVDPETREERYLESFKEVQQRMQAMAKHLKDLVVPPEHRDEIEDEGPLPEDDDGW